ncbi:MAG: Flp pilus assembly protein CpaB [Anaerolineae bacterium]
MKQRGGCLWLLVGLFLAAAAGGLAFTVMLSTTSAEPTQREAEPRAPVVMVARDVPPRTEIKEKHLITKDVPLSAIPDNAIREPEKAVGKVTTSQLVAGEILLNARIAEPGEQRGPQINFEIEPGQVVMAYPATDLMSRIGILEPGDVIDFLFSTETDDKLVTFWALQQVSITAVVLPSDEDIDPDEDRVKPESFLLALGPQDALMLKYLKDTDAILDIVLRARKDDTEFKPEPVNEQYMLDSFDINPEELP